MGRVLTNSLTLQYSIEASLGVLAGTPLWFRLEPNTINSFQPAITTVAREPISEDRQRKKGTITDLESNPEFEHDTVKHVVRDFVEAFLFASSVHPTASNTATSGQGPIRSGANYQSLAVNGTTNAYTHTALAFAFGVNRLVLARGFSIAANNGLKIVTGAPTTTSTPVTDVNLVDETPTEQQNAILEPAGVRAATGDLVWDVDPAGAGATGPVGSLTSTVLNFTQLGLTVGQFIHIGGLTSANWFSSTIRGYGRIISIAANLLRLDKLDATLLADDPGTGDTVDLLFGSFTRNVAVGSTNYIERSFQFELAFPNLSTTLPGTTMFSYAKGNMAGQWALEVPVADKSTSTFTFLGQDVDPPVEAASRKANAAIAKRPVETEALNTTQNVARIRVLKVDETALTSCIKSLTLTLDNQLSPEKCIGTLGATFVNTGIFLVDAEIQALFTHPGVVSAIRNNETVSFDMILRNGDGANAIDIPEMTLGDGSLDLPVNESVNINLAGKAHGAAAPFGYSVAVSTFPTVPLS